MLSLESPRWESLSHAYSSASNIPTILRDLQHESPSVWEQAWDDAWGALCHQGTVYTATYAAIPYIVDLADRTTNSERRDAYLIFVGAVALSADAAEIPDDLRADYSDAITQADPLVIEALELQPAREAVVIYLLKAIAALRGCTGTAQLIEGFADGELIPRCPAHACGVEIYVSIVGVSMFASVEDPATEKAKERIEITAPPRTAETGAWSDDAVLPLLVELARSAGHNELAEKLALWDGTVTCPKCREQFALRATMLNATDL